MLYNVLPCFSSLFSYKLSVAEPSLLNLCIAEVTGVEKKSLAQGMEEEVVRPCGACRVLRRKCSAETCVLAAYFPPSEPFKFHCVHRVFGASNIIRLLQEIKEEKREDAIEGMLFEAKARLKDPIYGSSGIVYNLHRRLSQMQLDLAATQAQLLNIQLLYQNLSNSVSASVSPPCAAFAEQEVFYPQPRCFSSSGTESTNAVSLCNGYRNG